MVRISQFFQTGESPGVRLRLFRRVAGYSFVTYLLLLGGVMAYRSADKPIGAVGQAVQAANTRNLQDESKLHLQDFHRVQMKGGRESYEIRAKDAKYFANEGVTYVTDAELTLPRKRGDTMKVFADSARLFLEGEVLERAELQGNVRVSTIDPMVMLTNAATYNSTDRTIVAPGDVDITGPGYSIQGRGLEMLLDTDVTTLHQNVKSRFDKGTEMPAVFGTARR